MKKTIFKVYDSNNNYIGYFAGNEYDLAKCCADDLGGRIEKDYIWVDM